MKLFSRRSITFLILGFLFWTIGLHTQGKPSASTGGGTLGVLLIDTDDTCRLVLDGKDQGLVKPDEARKISVSFGEHILKCTVEGIPDLVWRKMVEVNNSEQVATLISLKALHIQYDEVTAKLKKQKSEPSVPSTSSPSKTGVADNGQTVTPPSAPTAQSDLAATMKALGGKLSIACCGSINNINSIHLSPEDCRLSIEYYDQGSSRPSVADYYLEEDTDIDVVPFMGHYGIQFPYWQSHVIQFMNREEAQEAADMFVQAARMCAAASAPASSKTTGPSLEETLKFIAEQLDSQGPLKWTTTAKDPSTGQVFSNMPNSNYYFVPSTNLKGCTIKIFYDKTKPEHYLPISFRRIKDIQVMSWGEAMARVNERKPSSYTAYRRGNQVWNSPQVFTLRITTSDESAPWRDLQLADDKIAVRVGNAMMHAAELCGK